MKNSQALSAILLAITDALMGFLSFFLAYRLRLLSPHKGIPPFSSYLPVTFIYIASMILVFFFARLYYARRWRGSLLDEMYTIFGANSIAIMFTIAVISFVLKHNLDYQRLTIIYAWLISMVLISVGRMIHSQWRLHMLSRGVGLDNVLIVGTGEVARIILQKIQSLPRLGYRVVGFISENGERDNVLGMPVLGGIKDIPQVIQDHEVDEVIIALPEARHQELLHIISLCEGGRIGIKVFPDLFQIMAKEVSIGDLGGLPLLTVRDIALQGWRLTLKRSMDVIVSAVGLVLLSPLMMLTALLIKLESPGPVFYVQERMGLDARPFPMLKFRSMRQDAEANGPGWTSANDPRRTRVGAVLRKLSVDELPQLINVLLGDMSLVGPRPERPVYVEMFRKRIPRYMERHQEKAGITGWAQVNGLRGDTSITERTKYDLWYIENWSLWLDIKILLRTITRIFTDRNAY